MEAKEETPKERQLRAKREWRARNKEKVAQYNANYFQENSEKILRQRNKREQEHQYHTMYLLQKVDCCCGKELQRGSLYNHRKRCIVYQREAKTI